MKIYSDTIIKQTLTYFAFTVSYLCFFFLADQQG